MLIMLFGLTSAAFAGWVKDTQENTLPSVSHADSPHVRITIADGEAAVIGGDEVSARERAKNGAIRAAIEKVLGVYIEANSRGEDYVEVKDELLTHSSGYGYVLDILSAHVSHDIMHVKAKVAVSIDPIADRLALSGLTRKWRIMVIVPETHTKHFIPDPAAETAIISELLKSKYRLMDQSLATKIRYDEDSLAASHGDKEAIKRVFSRTKADILVTGEAISSWANDLAGGMVSCRARVEIKAIRRDTGEIISAISMQQGGVDLNEDIAAKTALDKAGREASKQLLRDLAVLPASTDTNVQVVISGCDSVNMLSSIEGKLKELSGVRSLQRDEFEDGIGYLDLAVDSASLDDIQSKLEQSKSPRLQIMKASKNYVEIRICH